MPLGKRINPSLERESPMSEDPKPQSSAEPDIKNAEFSLFQSEEPKYCFSDIILNNSTYDAIQDVLVLYEKRDLLFNKWGLGDRHNKHNKAGINLYGYSGTGNFLANFDSILVFYNFKAAFCARGLIAGLLLVIFRGHCFDK